MKKGVNPFVCFRPRFQTKMHTILSVETTALIEADMDPFSIETQSLSRHTKTQPHCPLDRIRYSIHKIHSISRNLSGKSLALLIARISIIPGHVLVCRAYSCSLLRLLFCAGKEYV